MNYSIRPSTNPLTPDLFEVYNTSTNEVVSDHIGVMRGTKKFAIRQLKRLSK